MSTKKSFSISKGLANGLRSSVESASTNHGQQLHYDMMPIAMIEPDPNNPRKLLISKEELHHGLRKSDVDYERKAKELNDLNELAESIKKVGVRNAIEVYKENNKYRIISGERRYLATLLTGQEYIPARINQKFDEFKLRYIQWVENINRQDLSLWEKYNNLISLTEAHNKTNYTELNQQLLKDLLGISATQAYRYLCLLNADKEIISLVEAGKITNLKLVQELVCIQNKTTRQQILKEIRKAKIEVATLSKFKTLLEKKVRVHAAINVGKTTLSTAKYLFNILLSDPKLNKYQKNFNSLDWSSTKAINKAFKNLLTTIDKELLSTETSDAI